MWFDIYETKIFLFKYHVAAPHVVWVWSQTNNYGGQCKRVGEWYELYRWWSYAQTTVTSGCWAASKEDWITSARKQGFKNGTGNVQIKMQNPARRKERTSKSQRKYCEYFYFILRILSYNCISVVIIWVNRNQCYKFIKLSWSDRIVWYNLAQDEYIMSHKRRCMTMDKDTLAWPQVNFSYMW